jgi:hypothetical protein
MDRVEFISKIKSRLKDLGEDDPQSVFISVEVASGKKIQTNEFMADLNKALFEADSKNCDVIGEDVFGLPLERELADKIVPCAKTVLGKIPLYSRNKDTPAYVRFGMNSVRAAPMGFQTRMRLKSIVEFVFSEEMEAKENSKGGVWYVVGDAYQPNRKDLWSNRVVASSIWPHDSFLEGGEESLSPDEWRMRLDRACELMEMRRNPSKRDKVYGEVCVFQRLEGAWHAESHFRRTFDEIIEKAQRWHFGASEGASTYVPRSKHGFVPSLYQFFKYINLRWSEGGEDKAKNFLMSIADVYGVLFDNPVAVQKCCRLFARFIIPMLNGLDAADHLPYERNFYVLMRNLIIHKMGFTYDTEKHSMSHPSDDGSDWAYWAGRTLHSANWIYRRFFIERGMDVPRLLIGQRFLKGVMKCPPVGLKLFEEHVLACETWAENRSLGGNAECEKRLNFFRDAHKKMKEALAKIGEIPNTTQPIDRVTMNAGYLEYRPGA